VSLSQFPFPACSGPLLVRECFADKTTAQGWAWSDEYRLKPVGILENPTVLLEAVGDGEDRQVDDGEEWMEVQAVGMGRSTSIWAGKRPEYLKD
jgi:hypothetical protein